MRSFRALLTAAWGRLDELLPLAAVPLVSTLLGVDKVRRIVAFDGFHLGVQFNFPLPLVDLWTFVSLPTESGVHVSPSLSLLPVVVLVESALTAGYLGGIHRYLRDGEYAFLADVRRYFLRFLGFNALVWGSVAVAGALAVQTMTPALLLVVGLVGFVLAYLFFGAPYLFVVADAGFVDGLARSYSFARDEPAYTRYAVAYLLFVAVASVVTTAVVANLGLFGVAVGALVTAPLSLALSVATVAFVADLANDERLLASDATLGPPDG
ncbi:hypothetical protein ACFQH6_03045 [Halobacteriaceae archaeon GCM10025711]